MLNRSILIGRLTKDPELRYTPAGVAVANFTLAVDRQFAKDETDFIPIVVWKQQAEHCANYLKKGRLCAVEGRIQVRSWEKDGKRNYATEVVADNVRFLEKAEGNKPAEGQQATRSVEEMTYDLVSGLRNAKLKVQDPFADDSKPINISDDDLPF